MKSGPWLFLQLFDAWNEGGYGSGDCRACDLVGICKAGNLGAGVLEAVGFVAEGLGAGPSGLHSGFGICTPSLLTKSALFSLVAGSSSSSSSSSSRSSSSSPVGVLGAKKGGRND